MLKLEYNVSRLCEKNTPKTLNLRQIMKVQNNNSVQEQDGNSAKPLLCVVLSENDLVELGFSKNLMTGTGWNTINSMRDAVYYYKKGRITINTYRYWTWFLDNNQRNDISVDSKDSLPELLRTYA